MGPKSGKQKAKFRPLLVSLIAATPAHAARMARWQQPFPFQDDVEHHDARGSATSRPNGAAPDDLVSAC